MNANHRRVSVSAVALGVLAIAIAACSHSATAPYTPVAPFALEPAIRWNVPPDTGGLADNGRITPTARVHALLFLRFKQETQLERFVDQVSDPDSRAYRQFLSSSQFDARFAPTAQHQKQVMAALRAAGLSASVSTGGLLVDADGPARAAEKFFDTRIHTFNSDYGTFYANVTPLSLPRSIGNLVAAVDLNDLGQSHADAPDLTPGPGRPLTGPTWGPDTVDGRGWGPRGVADGFQFPVQSGYNGSGVTVAIVMDPFPARSDLQKYYALYQFAHLGRVQERVVVGSPNPQASAGEATLDVETVSGLAPGANIIVYTQPALSAYAIVKSYDRAVSDNDAAIVSSSIGSCESNDRAYDVMTDALAVKGAALGITFVAAAGDRGSSCLRTGGSHVFGVNAPASDPHFLAVGGAASPIDLAKGLTNVAPPQVWNTWKAGAACCAGGGGISRLWTIPSYQVGIAGSASAAKRNVPDTSFPAQQTEIVLRGSPFVDNGTSWATPTTAALLSELVQICGERLGFVNPAFYKLYRRHKHHGEGTIFNDVTQGTNAIFGLPGYSAAPGYDDASGLGRPIGTALAALMCRHAR